MRREQLGAVPSTLMTDLRELTTTWDLASAGSGAATSRALVRPRPPKTSGKPLVFSDSRRPAESAWAWSGISELIPFRTALLRSEEHTSELQSRRDLVCRLL